MKEVNISQKIKALRQHVETLEGLLHPAPFSKRDRLSEAFAQCQTSLDELERAQQELLHQHEALTKAYQTIKQELCKEKEQSHHYLEIVEIIFLRLAADQTVTLLNRKGCTLLGYTAEELTGQNWFDTCLPAQVREEVRKVFQQMMAGELAVVEYYENPVLTKNGEEHLIAWHNTVLKNETGHVIGTLSAGIDITSGYSTRPVVQNF